MNDNELNSLGRVLAGVLRHFPEKFKLEMDNNGWIVIYGLINAIRSRSNQFHWLRPHHLLALVETDPKGRYQIKDNLIRATYGHSLDVDLDLPTDDIPTNLFYPTTQEEVELLMETGIRPSDRKKVHLSLSYEDAEKAGKVRVPHPIILQVDTIGSINAGNIIMHAGTTVFTTKEVPPEFIKVLDTNGNIIEEINIMKKSKTKSKKDDAAEDIEEGQVVQEEQKEQEEQEKQEEQEVPEVEDAGEIEAKKVKEEKEEVEEVEEIEEGESAEKLEKIEGDQESSNNVDDAPEAA
jgi:putative RNA 2'-phosphotransferase